MNNLIYFSMKKLNLFILINFFTILFSFNQTFAQDKIKEEVLAFEKARVKATLTADTKKLEQMLAEEVVWIHSSGKRDSKATYIQAIAEGKARYKTMSVEQSEARIYGEVAITNGVLEFESIATDGTITQVRTLFTCVYRKRKGNWQVVSWQTTRL
ncbi:MAG: hypothetical protein OHK0057_22350 [Thermoflexibacter sp.]